jgi:hypothetical protein
MVRTAEPDDRARVEELAAHVTRLAMGAVARSPP